MKPVIVALFDDYGIAARVRAGNSAITVHPRLDYEFDSVREILHRNKPVAVEEIR